ncbi:gamma-glutamylcyclotransferase [Rhodobacterales bacterium HKCCE2091]|nr:gamma-glutamylcyclotransferase [Rhodobacterales bacterium HKCCE2091]
MDAADPFRHHPGLRGRIADPETSFFRTLDVEGLAEVIRGHGIDPRFYPEAEREAGRRAFLAGHDAGTDLWVFAYGSLLWDPGIRFAEVRRARVAGHARRFILKDTLGGRGTAEAPGLMVALDVAPGLTCDGLAFRIAAGALEEETFQLWRRERIAPGYHDAWVTAETDHGPVRAVTFTADHDAELIDAALTFEDQARFAATGTGFLGTSLDYLRNIAAHLHEMRIPDPDVDRLLAEAEAIAAARVENSGPTD